MNRIKTKIIKADERNPKSEIIGEGARLIRENKLVAFPTETVYGLGANGLSIEAVEKIFIAKGRPQDNPLILHVSSIESLDPLVDNIPREAKKLMEEFWPGPLTILFERSKLVPDIITGGLDTVAIRMPNHQIALELIKASGVPIAAPSANTSGKTSPTMAKHVLEDLFGKIHMIIDGGSTGVGLESTVLDLTGDIPIILRPGGISLEDLRVFLPNVREDIATITGNNHIIPKSPGQKYKHYSPDAELLVFIGELEATIIEINIRARELALQGKKVGVMASEESKGKYNEGHIISVGSRRKLETIGHNLFSVLRKFDQLGVDVILAEGVESSGIGRAIMNRLNKASGGKIIKV